jgi:hypothetical protein
MEQYRYRDTQLGNIQCHLVPYCSGQARFPPSGIPGFSTLLCPEYSLFWWSPLDKITIGNELRFPPATTSGEFCWWTPEEGGLGSGSVVQPESLGSTPAPPKRVKQEGRPRGAWGSHPICWAAQDSLQRKSVQWPRPRVQAQLAHFGCRHHPPVSSAWSRTRSGQCRPPGHVGPQPWPSPP